MFKIGLKNLKPEVRLMTTKKPSKTTCACPPPPAITPILWVYIKPESPINQSIGAIAGGSSTRLLVIIEWVSNECLHV